MKKKIVTMALTFALGVSMLAGCGDDSSTSTTGAGNTTTVADNNNTTDPVVAPVDTPNVDPAGNVGEVTENYDGLWEFTQDSKFLYLQANGDWQYLNYLGDEIDGGYYEASTDGRVVLFRDDDYIELQLFLTDDGNFDSSEGTLVWTEALPLVESDGDVDITPFVGVWYNNDDELILSVADDYTWTLYDYTDAYCNNGTCTIYEGSLYLRDESGNMIKSLDLSQAGDLLDNENLTVYGTTRAEG